MGLGLEIRLEEIDQKIVLRLQGRIDAATAPALEKRLSTLMQEGRFKLLLDFSSVDYLSSAGMRVLLASLKKVKVQQGVFALFSLTEDVQDVMHLAGFDQIVPIFANEKEALQQGM